MSAIKPPDVEFGESYMDTIDNKIADSVLKDMPNLLTDEESAELVQWMAGIQGEPPDALKKILNNIAYKLSWAMAYQIVELLSRIQKTSKALRTIEDKIFNETYLQSLEPGSAALLDIYDRAVRCQENQLEFIRKFIVQNKDTLADLNNDVDEVKELLSQLPAAKLAKLKTKLKDLVKEGSNSEPQVTNEPTAPAT